MTYIGHMYDGAPCMHYLCGGKGREGPCTFKTPTIYKSPREYCPHPEGMVTETETPVCGVYGSTCNRCGLFFPGQRASDLRVA